VVISRLSKTSWSRSAERSACSRAWSASLHDE
jgi:hypothetical protein